MQHQIRANASQLQDYFSDLYAWEKSIGKEDVARKRAAKTAKPAAAPPPRTATVVGGSGSKEPSVESSKKPDAHTYDKGYKRWEKFDVQDAALREADEDGDSKQAKASVVESAESSSAPRRVTATSKTTSAATTKSREELEKEEGNAHYKRGDYVAAIKSYTRCLGYNPQNAVVLSNRAMAYLKNREFANAEDDCTLALKADPMHVKSYSRRGTARNSLGKHRLALLDFHRAASLDPNSRQIQTQLQSTRELIRTAIKRTPKRTHISIEVIGESSSTKQPQSEQDDEVSENKENRSQQRAEASLDSAEKKQKLLPLQESDVTPVSHTIPAANAATNSTKKKKSSVILPKLPKKAPGTSYEFGRVWKTLALRGDGEQKTRLLNLRADYLHMIDPLALRTVFKTGIESDVLCEIFHVLRHSVLSSESTPDSSISFTLAFAKELTKVPRFNMTIMLLSDKEKDDMAWVITRLKAMLRDEGQQQQVIGIKKLYELP
ncbi:unnamed protein product [Phytophthora lilii]|uniref:RNA polymerase II-associated protein 3 n=1 Tax=Phytophthora lilii TaxID=2077276 RepID=A0A9W6WQS3_9STRA|nr:unnamed protein product [Phytophthora lilii]